MKIVDDILNSFVQDLPEDQKESFVKQTKGHLDIKTLEMILVETMAEHYTTEELNALTEFYSSPLGQSILVKSRFYMDDIQMKIGMKIAMVILKIKEMEKKK